MNFIFILFNGSFCTSEAHRASSLVLRSPWRQSLSPDQPGRAGPRGETPWGDSGPLPPLLCFPQALLNCSRLGVGRWPLVTRTIIAIY